MITQNENVPGFIFSKFYDIIGNELKFLPEYRSEKTDYSSTKYLKINELIDLEPGDICKMYDSELDVRIIIVATYFGNIILFDKKPNKDASGTIVVHYNRNSSTLVAILNAITVVGSKDLFKILGKNYDIENNIGVTLIEMYREFENIKLKTM